jgi:predicted enzyme related to lactoylglutathione lyase
MPTRLDSVVIDATDPAALARFWATATGWPITDEETDEVVLEPPADEAGTPTEPGLPLVFGRAAGLKTGKNRLHLDLNSRSAEDQADQVAHLRRAGATPLDIGQGAVPWVVMADPEGNEFCVLDPRDDYETAGALAAIVLDTPDPARLAPFWAAATGWAAVAMPGGDVRLTRPDSTGPRLELLRVDDPKLTKNRLHLDVAPGAADDQAAEVARLQALGAREADIGQGTQTWVVLTDPDGNEMCVLSPRD